MATATSPSRTDASSGDAVRLRRALVDLCRLTQCCDRELACCHGVSAAGAHALETIGRLGSLSLNELAAELFVDKSTASRIVNGLEKEGLVSRVPDPEDRRAVRLGLTSAGRERRERIGGEMIDGAQALLAAYPEQTRGALVSALAGVARETAVRAGFSAASCCAVPEPAAPSAPSGGGMLADARRLLRACGLPDGGMSERFPRGYLLRFADDGDGLAAMAGVERYGEEGVLRSVAVRPDVRGRGLGREIARAAIASAAAEGVRSLYLLTDSARGFFSDLGFHEVKRSAVPPSIASSPEFRARECKLATPMVRSLEPPDRS